MDVVCKMLRGRGKIGNMHDFADEVSQEGLPMSARPEADRGI